MVKRDPAWKYATEVEGPNNIVYCKCNFCNLVVPSGISRLKNHLAGTHKGVKPCLNVPKNVKDEIMARLKKADKDKGESQNREADKVVLGSHHEKFHNEGGSSQGSVSSTGIDGPVDEYVMDFVAATPNDPYFLEFRPSASEIAKAVRQHIARFFYENGIPFHVASSPSFIKMIESVAKYGPGLDTPSARDIFGPLLDEEKKCTDAYLADVKKTWLRTGVSIISDGWTDNRGRQMINFLVNNPNGTVFLKTVDASDAIKSGKMLFKLLDAVVEEVGEELVVQVLTDNASNYVEAGKLLMEKRQHLWWTPCVAHCIDLMLAQIGELPQYKIALKKAKMVTNYIYNHDDILDMMRNQCPKELVRPATTQFGTTYLTLQSMVDMKLPLQSMFTSPEWLRSPYSKQAEGKKVEKIILDEDTWQSVSFAIKTTKPLFTVLRMANCEKMPSMGFLYCAMERAKKEIKESLDNNLGECDEIIKIIDEKWENQMYRPLHTTACFLNPHFQYDDTWTADVTMKTDIYTAMEKLIPNLDDRCQANLQLDNFIARKGFYGKELPRRISKRRPPAGWWDAYEFEGPELSAFAIKVLSLTCSSMTCEKDWNNIYQAHRKSSAEKVNTLAYVTYNKKLRERHLRKTSLKEDEEPLALDRCPSDDEWIVGSDGEEASGAGIDSQQATNGEGDIQCTQGKQGVSREGTSEDTPRKTYSRKRKITPDPSVKR